MLLNRIKPILDKHPGHNQNGFRSGRSTTSKVLALRRLIEGVKYHNLLAVSHLFLDFHKSFNSIRRDKILKTYSLPDDLIRAIKCLKKQPMFYLLMEKLMNLKS